MIVFLILYCTICLGSVDARTPKVLFLMSDSHDGRTLDPTDRAVFPLQYLPNLRRLADRSANFVRTYAASPQCTPSRASMYTGRRNDLISVYHNGVGLARNHETGNVSQACLDVFDREQCEKWMKVQNTSTTFKEHLERHGVNVTIFGKTHIGGDIVAEGPKGFDDAKSQLSTLVRGARVEKPTGDWLVGGTDVANVSDPLPPWRYNGKTNKDPNTYKACIEALNQISQDQPQLLHCSFFSPHPPFDTNASYLSKITSDPPLPPSAFVDQEQQHPADRLASIQKLHHDYSYVSDDNVQHNVTVRYSKKQVETVRRVYYAMGAELDSWIGGILDALNQREDAQDWYVIYLSDHGEMGMEHLQTGKNTMYEASVRVPFLLSGTSIESKISTDLVSLLDVFPTLCDLFEVETPSDLSGRSVLLSSSDRAVISQYHSLYSGVGTYMVRQGDYKLVLYGDYDDDVFFEPQLFDVENDPFELTNLASKRSSVVKNMTSVLSSIFDWQATDRIARDFQRTIYRNYVWTPDFNTSGTCIHAFNGSVFSHFDKEDANRVEIWSGLSCR